MGKLEPKLMTEEIPKKTLRRSLYFSKNLRKGDKIKREDLMTLRPYHPNAVKIEI